MYLHVLFLYLDTPNRKEVFSDRVSTFETHCKGMSETAADLAKAGGIMDKTAVEELMRSSAKVQLLYIYMYLSSWI